MAKPDKNTPHDANGDPPTTGHEWDGIKEWDNPLPRWWVLTFYATIIWAVVYWVVMPAWPIPGGQTNGVLGHSDRREVARDVTELQSARAPMMQLLTTVPLEQVSAHPEAGPVAQEVGRLAFAANCATCHGAGGQGVPGYPSLADDVWLWDGSIAGIRETLEVGIRSEHSGTRFNAMPAYGRDGIFTREQVTDATQYVLQISGQQADRAAAARGAQLYAANCVSCHGADGRGDQAQGAPNLIDQEWLYGGSAQAIASQITNGRGGVMPAWNERLDPATLNALAVYVHDLGGGV
jgi:cytochrome c oxidase cbb3-type subunit 3